MVEEGVVTAVDGSDVAVRAESACVHGDSPGAVEMAAARARRRSPRAGVTRAGVRMKVLPFGDAALLVEVDDLRRRARPGRRGRAARPAGRARRGARGADRAASRSARAPTSARCAGPSWTLAVDAGSTRPTGETVEIPVVYDGPDLAEVARAHRAGRRRGGAAHTGTPWRVAFGGFAPGFAYLTGGDAGCGSPRRDEPRTTVPAGAVGLAGEFSGVYPRPSPGGWQLIGRPTRVLWDAARTRPRC